VAAACLTTSLSIYISISISVYVSVYVSVYLSISISVYISVYQSIYVSPSFSSLHILPEHSANLCCHRWQTSHARQRAAQRPSAALLFRHSSVPRINDNNGHNSNNAK
jgi:hypothetical protein